MNFEQLLGEIVSERWPGCLPTERWVLVYETLETDGTTSIVTAVGDRTQAWDALGFLQWAQLRLNASVNRLDDCDDDYGD